MLLTPSVVDSDQFEVYLLPSLNETLNFRRRLVTLTQRATQHHWTKMVSGLHETTRWRMKQWMRKKRRKVVLRGFLPRIIQEKDLLELSQLWGRNQIPLQVFFLGKQ